MTKTEQITKLRKTVERVRTTISKLANEAYEGDSRAELKQLREIQRGLNTTITLLNQYQEPRGVVTS
jgi:hypothetical protein